MADEPAEEPGRSAEPVLGMRPPSAAEAEEERALLIRQREAKNLEDMRILRELTPEQTLLMGFHLMDFARALEQGGDLAR